MKLGTPLSRLEARLAGRPVLKRRQTDARTEAWLNGAPAVKPATTRQAPALPGLTSVTPVPQDQA